MSRIRKALVPAAVAAALAALGVIYGEESLLYAAAVQVAIAFGVYRIPNAQ